LSELVSEFQELTLDKYMFSVKVTI
jgi:hypothetical protein